MPCEENRTAPRISKTDEFWEWIRSVCCSMRLKRGRRCARDRGLGDWGARGVGGQPNLQLAGERDVWTCMRRWRWRELALPFRASLPSWRPEKRGRYRRTFFEM